MTLSRLMSVLLLSAAVPMAAHAALPRFPQPYGDRIVFVADGNVWTVPKTGGTAERLTSAPGQDMFPRVSPDGKWIAYTEASRAGTDVWVIPATGGAARRLTFYPTTEAGTGGRHGPDNMVVTWTPDSRSVVYLSKLLDVLNGPKVALLNHWSASDGDIFPNLFKAYGLGKLIGTRSWGGVRGIRGNMTMMDGGYVTVPESAPYTTERVWSVENHGVDPDIEVENMPADLLAGHDAQLETAVAVLLEQIKGKAPGYPAPPPLLPPYPPSGMVAPRP